MASVDLPEKVSVLIAGGGPVGLTLACLLAKRGVSCLLVNREATTSRAPRAHVINRRTMEIFREIGLATEVTIAGTPPQSMRHIVWATTMSEPSLAQYEAWGTSDERLQREASLSPERVVNLPQHYLEPMLCTAATERFGALVRFGYEVVGFDQSGSDVRVTVRGPGGGLSEVTCDYLVAADGGRSRLRDLAGLKLTGEAALRTAVSAFFKADLSTQVRGREGLLYILLHPQATGVLIGARLPDEWVFMYPLPPQADPKDYGSDRMGDLIRIAVGQADLQLEMLDIQSWRTNALVADRYSAGRVFLAGDAAHLNSPTGGLGMNTGIQDAHNLAWKLQAVIAGWASPSLLETYDAERRPVGRINIDQSLRNLQLLGRVREALGLTPVPTPSQDVLPHLASLPAALTADEGMRRRLEAAVDCQFEQFDAIGIDLGFVYQEGAICLTDEGAGTRADVGKYLPTTAPGARLPHAWVEVGGRECSTLDLVAGEGLSLLHGDTGTLWPGIAKAAAEAAGVPLHTLCIGKSGEVFDRFRLWASVNGVASQGAVLVRPDGHVAWRSQAPVKVDRLASVLRSLVRAG